MGRVNKKMWKEGLTIVVKDQKMLDKATDNGWVMFKDVNFIWIVNYDQLVQEKIGEQMLEEWKEKGFVKGKLPTKLRMVKGEDIVVVPRSEFRLYLTDGWKVYHNKYRKTSNNYSNISDKKLKNNWVNKHKRLNKEDYKNIESFPI